MEINKDIIQNEIIRPTVTRRIGIAITDFFMFIFLFLTFNTYIISIYLNKIITIFIV